MKLVTTLIMASALMFCSGVFAASKLEKLQTDWAIANYKLVDEEQTAAFESLIEDANEAVGMSPDSAELLIWKGIIESTYAGKASGLSALSLVKSARRSLEGALELDAMALDGSAYTSLGALYYQVPPWPIAFGSDKKARKFLTKALEINPKGIDSNYFYGAFLIEEREFEAARAALQKASQAPDRPGRGLADRGRREEIQNLLDSI